MIDRLVLCADPDACENMPEIFHYSRRVEFCETDTAGIAHFSAFFQYMEQAEHALLRHVSLSVHLDDNGTTISWPRVSASCDFKGAAKFEDVLDVAVGIERIGERSVTYHFTFSNGGTEIARGVITSVCCQIEHGSLPRSIPIPEWIAERLQPYLG